MNLVEAVFLDKDILDLVLVVKLVHTHKLVGGDTEIAEAGIRLLHGLDGIGAVIPSGIQIVILAVQLQDVPCVTAAILAVFLADIACHLGTLHTAFLEQVLNRPGIALANSLTLQKYTADGVTQPLGPSS